MSSGTESSSSEKKIDEKHEDFHVYYLGYGSNMCREKVASRGSSAIKYTDVLIARVKDWRLTFDIRALPPIEPVMGSIEHSPGNTMYGVVYKMATPKDWDMLLKSEGVGNVTLPTYELVQIEAECFKGDGSAQITNISVYTLRTREKHRNPDWRESHMFPSKRYMSLLVNGAKNENLPIEYIHYLQSIPTARTWGSFPVELIALTIPLRFWLRKTFGRHATTLINTLCTKLYIRHEQVVRKNDRNVFRIALSYVLFYAFMFLTSLYVLPSIILISISKKRRNMYFKGMKDRLAARKQTNDGTTSVETEPSK